MKIPPPILLIVCLIISWQLDRYIPIIDLGFIRQVYLIAILVVLGVILELYAIWGFIKAKTTVNPLHPERTSTLVVTGFYAYTRNPMYLGMSFLYRSWAVDT